MTKTFDLSVLAAPIYTVKLPSTGKEVKMRTLLTKEHKALMIANESSDKIDAIEQCLSNCIQSEINIRELPIGDAEYLFLHMYMNSNGIETLTADYKCAAPLPEDVIKQKLEEKRAQNSVETGIGDDDFFAEIVAKSNNMSADELIDEVLAPSEMVCGTSIKTDIDLKASFVPDFTGTDKVKVNDQVTITLKHPSIVSFENNDPLTPEGLFNLSADSIHEVYVGDTVFTHEELVEQDILLDIMEELDTAAYKKIQSFVDEVPRLCCHIDVVCPTCGNKEKITLRGIEDFFV